MVNRTHPAILAVCVHAADRMLIAALAAFDADFRNPQILASHETSYVAWDDFARRRDKYRALAVSAFDDFICLHSIVG